jgi:type I restriction enzyme S subunit
VDFSGLNNGGAIPTLNRNTLSNIPVVEAPKALQDEYVRIVEPIFSAIRNAKKQIEYLRETRDRLLPKLMNGEIEV